MKVLLLAVVFVAIIALVRGQSADEERRYIKDLFGEALSEETQYQPMLFPEGSRWERLRNQHRPLKTTRPTSDTDEDTASTCTVTASALNIRSRPSTSASVVGSARSGASVSFLGDAGSANGYQWAKISVNGVQGYVAKTYLRCSGSKPSGQNCHPRNYPTFKQCDPSWRNDRLGSSGTICSIGCLMSSVSMALNGLGKHIDGKASNPHTLNAWLNAHSGYYGNLFVWGSVSRLGLSYVGKVAHKDDVVRNVCAGNRVVIANVRHGAHWVLLTGVTASGYSVNDPGYTQSSYSFGDVVEAGVFQF